MKEIELDYSTIGKRIRQGRQAMMDSQGFCKSKMAEIQPPDGDESF